MDRADREDLTQDLLLAMVEAKTAAPASAAPLLRHALAHRIGHALHALALLLLTGRELPQPFERFVYLLFSRIGAPLLLHGFVLIPLPIGLQLKEIGEILV